MATIASPASVDLDRHRNVSRGSLTVAGMSTVVEWYDFTLYGYFTPVISRVFFGGGTSGVAATLLIFAASYLLRPVGAAFFGHLGDRIGRRPVLLWSMALMTVAMLATAALPTYAQVGALAGWLMLMLRCVMSFSVGGEYSGVITYLVEGSEPKKRGFITSLASAASEVGGLMAAGLAALATSLLVGDQLDAWGWRIPFLIGALLAGGTLLARSMMEESPVFDESDGTAPDDKAASSTAAANARLDPTDAAGKEKNPLFAVLRSERTAVARGFAISALGSITYYVGVMYAPTFLTGSGKFSDADAMWLATAAAVVVIVITPISGMLADRIGRRPLLIAYAALSALLSLTMFQLMSLGTTTLALIGALTLAAVAGGWSAVAAATIPEQFTSRARMSGMALGFTTATAIFGGFAPLIAEKLISVTGWKPAPGAMIAVVALCVLPVIMKMPETAPSQTAERA